MSKRFLMKKLTIIIIIIIIEVFRGLTTRKTNFKKPLSYETA